MVDGLGSFGARREAFYIHRMGRRSIHLLPVVLAGAALVLAAAPHSPASKAVAVAPARMPRIGSVSPRFFSYNIEMARVTGGNFWKPYGKPRPAAPPASLAHPAAAMAHLFQYQPPIDLSNPRLRKLARALGPAYVRVSGTWANSVYFQTSAHSTSKPPAGFSAVLTKKEWKGVIDFVRAVNGALVTSFAVSPGTRNARGVWTPREAHRWLAYSQSIGGRIAAAEFMNEPNFAAMGGAPQGYTAAAFGRDTAVFGPWLHQRSPGTLFLGPGSAGEGPFALAMPGTLPTAALLRDAGPVFNAFSYHLYPAVSQRCALLGAAHQTTAAAALSPEWLSRPEKIAAFYAHLRDRFDPGTPLWVTETAGAACGGNPWASTFLDTFRFLVEHASLARHGVRVIMHNTLAASDYGLLDENTFAPRPDYWASVLWHRLMGPAVLDPQVPATPHVYVYAQCLARRPGGVALLVINAGRRRGFALDLPLASERYTLTAKKLASGAVELNGRRLRLTRSGSLPPLRGEFTRAGRVRLAPASITFFGIANAANPRCQ